MEWAVILPLVAFVAILALLASLIQRAGRIVARSRALDGFRNSVRDLTARIEVSLEGATRRIDGVRRGEAAPGSIGDTLTAATDAVERYLEEARRLEAPDDAGAIREDLIGQLERAGRALGMVEHGTTILAAVRRGSRELEAQTSIKRGYLNLLHAREAILHTVERADQLADELSRQRSTEETDAWRRSA